MQGIETGSKGTHGGYPLSDLEFDIVTVIYEKSKALQAYEAYLRDSQQNPKVREVFEHIAEDDRKHVQQLKQFLGTCAK